MHEYQFCANSRQQLRVNTVERQITKNKTKTPTQPIKRYLPTHRSTRYECDSTLITPCYNVLTG